VFTNFTTPAVLVIRQAARAYSADGVSASGDRRAGHFYPQLLIFLLWGSLFLNARDSADCSLCLWILIRLLEKFPRIHSSASVGFESQ